LNDDSSEPGWLQETQKQRIGRAVGDESQEKTGSSLVEKVEAPPERLSSLHQIPTQKQLPGGIFDVTKEVEAIQVEPPRLTSEAG
jgi:hypothetical protein